MIQIINGFKINSKHPVDSRIIVDDEATRLAILYKYHGLRVWQTDTNTPYFWDGTDWKSELDLVVTGDGTETDGHVPYFSDSDPVKIGASIISVTPDLVTINGDLSFDSITSGSIDAGLINTGTMSIDRLTPGSNNQVLQTVGTTVQWENLTDLTIGNSTNSHNSNNLKIKTINISDTYQLVLRNVNSDISGTGGKYIDLFSHVNGLKFKNDGGNGLRILAHNGSPTNPPYSFHSATEDSTNTYNTGMYRPANNEIGFSVSGQQAVRITSSYINFGIDSEGSPRIRTNNNTSPTSPSYTWWGNDQTGMYRPDQDVIGFSIAGNLMGFFESDGLRIKDKNGSPSGYINVSYIGVPIGGIIMWSGNINNIGNGHLWNFRLCDGQTIPGSVTNPDDGTALTPKYTGQKVPDLRERFVVGAGDNPIVDGYGYSVGAIGGSNFVTLNPGQVPLRNHAHGPGDLNITSSGSHKHGYQLHGNSGTDDSGYIRRGQNEKLADVSAISGDNKMELESHTHPEGSFSGNTGYAGIETGIGGHENRPPYYAVAFIIRIV